MKGQTPLKAQTLPEDPFIVVLDHVDDGRSAPVRSAGVEIVHTDGLLGPDCENIGAGMDRQPGQGRAGRGNGDAGQMCRPEKVRWLIFSYYEIQYINENHCCD